MPTGMVLLPYVEILILKRDLLPVKNSANRLIFDKRNKQHKYVTKYYTYFSLALIPINNGLWKVCECPRECQY